MLMSQIPVTTEVLGAIRLLADQQLQLRFRQVEGQPAMVELSQFNPAEGNLLACFWPDDPKIHRKLADLLVHRADQLEADADV